MSSIRTRYLSDAEARRIYQKHPHLGRSYQSYCPTCDKQGSYLWKGQNHDCDCEWQLQLHKHYLAAGIGVTYQRLSFDDFQGPPDVVKNVNKYLVNRKNFLRRGMGLYFFGTCGTGKTMCANLVLKELVKDGYTCWATTFSQMSTMFTAGWSDRSDQEYFRKKFINSEVLLLDDVGNAIEATKNRLAETTFDAVLRQRVQDGRTTFITSNMTPAGIQSGYGAATLSLIREKSLELKFDGSDFRNNARDRESDEVLRGEVRPIV